ncbi:L-fucose/L-arabinose isomerase family protein [Amycolatopsis rhabdoformis]|uniref:FucIase n=1 Tax=Amycolatopsis rhabdoformis TaxID=1448059 RepID=A0ABZ1IAA7_9PSEU|nr:L-fucose/L-arabinose isomerase family protein [Amycolatopsis rhabdoformis]WSE31355.1 L-fucose/L-arabinose isomerase family protein [Amycolatopsis rhabdoformis]
MTRVGVIAISDGRDHVHRRNTGFIRSKVDDFTAALTAAGHDVISGGLVATNTTATAAARSVAAASVDVTVFYYAVWSFPHFTMLAADATTTPLLLVASTDPAEPGLVGMLAAGGALDQIGRRHTRLWGEPDDAALIDEVGVHARAASAVASLRGSTFGRFGGRPMGMNTAVANTDQWMRQFGVDVEEIDQYELVLRAEKADAGEAARGREWLERLATVHYDGVKLTPALLERQLRTYLAVRDLAAERHLDFSGIKAQPELTENFVTMDVAEALLNDPYDWNGPKAVHVTATESDMDGALTMQLMHRITGTPVLFADVRHFHADRGVWDLCNSGQHATWFAARSDDPGENLGRVNLYPSVFFFPAGGASVAHFAAPGRMTLGRLSRWDGEYRLQVVLGEFELYDEVTNVALAERSTPEWPHAFARLDVEAGVFLRGFGANHVHAVPGDWRRELRVVGELMGVKVEEWGR